jgi:hypothetical protein
MDDDRDPFDDDFDEFEDDLNGGADDDPSDPDAEAHQLDEHEAALVLQDLSDLEAIEASFTAEGYRGVSVFCVACDEEHYYPWDLLRGNLEMLLETGDLPVHEPAYAPEPDRYVPWEYARGYVDALRDVGADQRLELGSCPRCQLELTGGAGVANFCPRCGTPLLAGRLREALAEAGVDEATIDTVATRLGLLSR